MGYQAGSLNGLVEAVHKVTPLARRNLCEAGAEEVLERVMLAAGYSDSPTASRASAMCT